MKIFLDAIMPYNYIYLANVEFKQKKVHDCMWFVSESIKQIKYGHDAIY